MILIRQIDYSVALFFFFSYFINNSSRTAFTFASPSTLPDQVLADLSSHCGTALLASCGNDPMPVVRSAGMRECRYKRVTVKECHTKRHVWDWCNSVLGRTVTTGFFSCWSWLGGTFSGTSILEGPLFHPYTFDSHRSALLCGYCVKPKHRMNFQVLISYDFWWSIRASCTMWRDPSC